MAASIILRLGREFLKRRAVVNGKKLWYNKHK